MKKAICFIVLCVCMSFSAAATTQAEITVPSDVTVKDTSAVTTTDTTASITTTSDATTIVSSTIAQPVIGSEATTANSSTAPSTTIADDVITTGGDGEQTTTAWDNVTTGDGGITTLATPVQNATTTAGTTTSAVVNHTTKTRTTIKNGRVTTTSSSTIHTTRPTASLQTLYVGEGITVQAAAGVFPQNTQIGVQRLTEGPAILSSLAERFTAYGIIASVDTGAVYPRGTFTVTLAIPEEYAPQDAVMVLIDDTGNAKILVSKVDASARTVTAEVDTVGIVAVAKLQTAKKSDPWLTVAAVAVVAAAVTYFYFHKRKK